MSVQIEWKGGRPVAVIDIETGDRYPLSQPDDHEPLGIYSGIYDILQQQWPRDEKS